MRAERLKVSGKPDKYTDLSIFMREQELMQRLVAESRLPRLELDISDNDLPRAVKKIADWMESIGSLRHIGRFPLRAFVRLDDAFRALLTEHVLFKLFHTKHFKNTVSRVFPALFLNDKMIII